MASNALANIAAATGAGYALLRWVRQSGQNVTELKAKPTGLTGQAVTGEITFMGEGPTTGAADTVALANLNAWRSNRYGSNSAGINISPTPNPGATPSTTLSAPVHGNMTKDKS